MDPELKNIKASNNNCTCLRLISLKNGQKSKIVRIEGGRMMNQRLNDMGLTIGTIITIEREAPFGGPIQIVVRGSSLALGRGIASRVFVQPV